MGILEAGLPGVIDNIWGIWNFPFIVGLGPDYCILTIGPKIQIFR